MSAGSIQTFFIAAQTRETSCDIFEYEAAMKRRSLRVPQTFNPMLSIPFSTVIRQRPFRCVMFIITLFASEGFGSLTGHAGRRVRKLHTSKYIGTRDLPHKSCKQGPARRTSIQENSL